MLANNAFIIKEMEENAKEIGEARGEKKKAIEIAKNLLDVLNDKTISIKTGLNTDEVKKLREESNIDLKK